MKFDRRFQRHQDPRWAYSYFNYRLVKTLIKTAHASIHQHDTTADLKGEPQSASVLPGAGMRIVPILKERCSKQKTLLTNGPLGVLTALDEDLVKVELFYLKRLSIIQQRVELLYERYGIEQDFLDKTDLILVNQTELKELLKWFLGFTKDLEELQQFTELNRNGVQRILRKLDPDQNPDNSYFGRGFANGQKFEFLHHSKTSLDIQKMKRVIDRISFALVDSKPFLRQSLLFQTFCDRFCPSFNKSWPTYLAISNDDSLALEEILEDQSNRSKESIELASLLLAMLRCAILFDSSKCTSSLLGQIQTFKSSTLVEKDYNIQKLRLIITLLLKPTSHKNEHQSQRKQGSTKPIFIYTSAYDQSRLLLDWLHPHALSILNVRDNFGRLPLHDAATNGQAEVCKLYLDYMREHENSSALTVFEAILCRDIENYTPIHLAIISCSLEVADLLLEYSTEMRINASKTTLEESLQSLLNELLYLAVIYNQPKTTQSLLRKMTSINYRGPSKESILYTAAKLGLEEIVTILLKSPFQLKADIEHMETVRGWTPLMVASAEGHLSIAVMLVEAGADQRKQDRFGWTANEHAAYRGYLDIARLLTMPSIDSITKQSSAMTVKGSPSLKSITFIDHDSSKNVTKSHILITLGSPNIREEVEAVDLPPHQSGITGYTGSYSGSNLGCVLEINAIGAEASIGMNQYIQLPILEDTINQPLHFTTELLDQVKLVFSISQPAGSDNAVQAVGSGVAILSKLQHGLAPKREGLARYHTVPILEKDTLQFIGTVTFGLVVITPPPQAEMVIPQSAKRGFWEGGPTQVVGHRGSGANTTAHTALQLGENTVQSFQSAAEAGASGVEFDVQLTKDLIPVIYHDFLVMEAGGDTPLYTLRLDQFLHLSRTQSFDSDLPSMAEKRYKDRTKTSSSFPIKQRSYSLSIYDHTSSANLMERMKLTEAAMEGAHKGNLRGDSIHGTFPTFEDLFINLPDSVHFNVEMKYPMLWEAEDRNMDRYAPEINAYVNIVLSMIYRLGGKRSITFSSFSPEVCILLSLKQQDYPVLFLSKAGSIPVGDVRSSGLQQSIRFAKRWNLAGIVILSDPLVMCPRLVGYAKSAGLRVCSYGPLNNEPEYAKIQAKAGLDVIIVDKVRLISETLARAQNS